MPTKRTVDLADDVEQKWKRYESNWDASFSKMANKAISEYLDRKLGKK